MPTKGTECVDCQTVYVKRFLNRMGRCPNCAQIALRDNAIQIKAHQGPYYERWLNATKRAMEEL